MLLVDCDAFDDLEQIKGVTEDSLTLALECLGGESLAVNQSH